MVARHEADIEMKILGLRTSSGSNFHRVGLPLSYMKADMVDKLSEEIVKNHGVLWIHYGVPFAPAQIGVLKSRYNLKVVVDIDDSWSWDKSHPDYNWLQKTIQRSKELCVIADHVVCATPLIADMVNKYNSNTVVIGNGIPWGEGQFQVWREEYESFMNRKIRIGLVGSASHFEDWESIRGKMKRVLSDGEIKNKCEFVIGGYTDSNKRSKQLWDKASTILGNPVKRKNKKVYDYIDLYRGLDILLCPLVDNHPNRCRSNLKVFEAACTDTLCILGDLYHDKWDHNHVHLYEDWYNNIKTLIKDKDKLYQQKMEVSQYVRQQHDYNERCVQPRLHILNLPNKTTDLNIYGITYSGQHTEYKEYKNEVRTPEEGSAYFEYNALLNLLS